MKNTTPLVLAVFLLLPNLNLQAQSSSGNGEILAISTGQSTGIIGHLYLTGNARNFSMPESIIKPIPLDVGQLSQAYVTEELQAATFPGEGDTLKIPIEGYCLDARKPPVPFGANLPLPETWIRKEVNPENPFFPIEEGESMPPASLPKDLEVQLGRPFSIPYDCFGNPDLVSELVFPAFTRIKGTYQDLNENGEIITPYTRYQNTQRKTVIQYCLWNYTSTLEGDPFSRTEFDDRMQRQYNDRLGGPVELATPERQEQFNTGMDQLWTAFGQVTAGAAMYQPAIPVEEVPDSCHCNSCTVATPWKFTWLGLLSDGSIKTLSGQNSIPFGTYLKVTPPDIQATCNGDCTSNINTNLVVNYTRPDGQTNRNAYPTDSIFTFYFNTPGEVEFIFTYQCICEDGECTPDSLTKTYTAVSSNACCGKLRDKNTGTLNLMAGNGQYVEISNDNLTLSLTEPDETTTFTFPINIEAAFCNLDDNRVLSFFNSKSSAHKELDHSLVEDIAITDVLLSHSDNSGGQDPYYHMSIQLQKDGKEIQLTLALDQKSCKYDISVFYDDRFVEYTQQVYSPSELIDLVLELPDTELGESQYWNRMLFLGMQFLKGMESDPDGFGTKYKYWKSKLEGALSKLLNSSGDPTLSSAGEGLLELSYSNPEPESLMTGLMQFINQFHNPLSD